MEIFITLLIFTISGKSQCGLDQLFPVELGTSKFDARIKMSSYPNFVNRNNELDIIGNFTYSYLSHISSGVNTKQDNYNQLLYELKDNDCFNNLKNQTWLFFRNDYLYSFRYVIDFQINNIDDGKKTYNYLTQLYDKKYETLSKQFKSNGEKTGIGKSYVIYKPKNAATTKMLNISYKYVESIEVLGKYTEPHLYLEIELIDTKFLKFNPKK